MAEGMCILSHAYIADKCYRCYKGRFPFTADFDLVK